MNEYIVVSNSDSSEVLILNAAARAASAIRLIALVTATAGLAALPGHQPPSCPRHGTALEQLETLRHRTHDLFASAQYSEASKLFEFAYRRAAALGEPEYAIRFLNGLGSSQFALFEYQRALGSRAIPRRPALDQHDFLESLLAVHAGRRYGGGETGRRGRVARPRRHKPAVSFPVPDRVGIARKQLRWRQSAALLPRSRGIGRDARLGPAPL